MLRTILIFVIIFILLSFIKSIVRTFRMRSKSGVSGTDKPGKKKDDSKIIDAKYEEIK